jgi:hypothetical protein
MTGEPDVAIVEPDDVEPPLHQLRAELVRPVDQLAAETVHKDNRRMGGVTEGLVRDVDLAHGETRETIRRRHEPRLVAGPTPSQRSGRRRGSKCPRDPSSMLLDLDDTPASVGGLKSGVPRQSRLLSHRVA